MQADVTPDRRALLLCGDSRGWDGLRRSLAAQRVECTLVLPGDCTAAIAAVAARDDTVVFVDLSGDQVRGMAAVAACRRLARRVPVVVVAQNPSLDLVRRVRLSGVFYLALEPIATEELRTLLHDAYESLLRGRVDASVCRSRPKILIIDDDSDFCASATALLRAQGYTVSAANSGREGLARVATEHPDLVVLDVVMETDWVGYEVNQALKFGPGFEGARHTPILMVSSVPIDPATRFAMAGEVGMVSADGYFTKPLDIPVFLEHLRTFLGKPDEDEGASAG